MSEPDMGHEGLDELLSSEGLAGDGIDDLVAWARERAAALAAEAATDPDLGPLLSGSVAESAHRPVSHSDATTEPRARQPEADAPQMPVRTGQTEPNPSVSVEAAAASDIEVAVAQAAHADDGFAEDPAAAQSGEFLELDDVEMLEDDELEMVEDDGPSEDSQAAPPPAPPPSRGAAEQDAPTFGPPDGSESVPEWKAALFSAELGDDKAAAAKVREESTVGPMPQAPEEPIASHRLVAEEDEISQHNIDLSDLDGA